MSLTNAPKEKTKVVVRKLPPALTQDSFKATIDQVIGDCSYDWLSYYQGKTSLKKTVFSRAYINFTQPDHVLEFKAKFDGHVFVSTKGTQYRCSVEYAPFQKVPKVVTKKHPLDGTIENDPDYQQFVRELEEGPQLLPSATAQREAQERAAAADGTRTDSAAPKVTKLMQYLQEKYAAGLASKAAASKKARRGQPETPATQGKQDAATPTKERGRATKTSVAAATAAATAAVAATESRSKSGQAEKQQAAVEGRKSIPSTKSASKEPVTAKPATSEPSKTLLVKTGKKDAQAPAPSSPPALAAPAARTANNPAAQARASKAAASATTAAATNNATNIAPAVSKQAATSNLASTTSSPSTTSAVKPTVSTASTSSTAPAARAPTETAGESPTAESPAKAPEKAKRVRAGFQAYVPGAMRRQQTAGQGETTDAASPDTVAAAAAAAIAAVTGARSSAKKGEGAASSSG